MFDTGPKKTEEELLFALKRVETIRPFRLDDGLNCEFIQHLLRQYNIRDADISYLVPVHVRTKQVRQVIAHLEEDCKKEAA